MDSEEDLSKSVHDTGRRMTQQRCIILEVLQSVTSHPTAAELHQMVSERLPQISPGTIYRNLNVLSELGFVQELKLGTGPARYDGNVQHHTHVRCSICDRVADVPVSPGVCVADADDALEGWRVTGYDLEFEGLCPQCAAQRPHTGDH